MLTSSECDYKIERDKGCFNINCEDCFYNQKDMCFLFKSSSVNPDDVYRKYKQMKLLKMKEILQ